MITVTNLSKSFQKKTVLANLSIQFKPKEIYVIVGMNGCGKTTFMNTMMNLLKADSGTIMCHGEVVGTKDYKKSIFYIPSDFYLPDYLTADEYLKLTLRHYPNSSEQQVDLLFSIFDLEDHRYQLLESYSFGMKKKIQLIAAIAANTDYVFADELFSGLDFDTVLLVQELLLHLKRTRSFIVVSHDLNTLQKFPENIYIMNKGTLTKFEGEVNAINEHVKETGDIGEKIRNIRKYFISA
ncbi:ABC transporter ATP-binding protein [Streptococcus ovis]|uniref:ATP-binding cassette domain-containing protein n=1 Tax=Streptococcus ovis TaxID=82806 RepID=UPI000361C262|nr:ABC transporter ATP-binding protein [Streptococcus ovis]